MKKSIYEIIKASGAENGEDFMWETTKLISDAIEESMPEEARHRLYGELYGMLSKGHYNAEFAKEAIEKMYYTGEDGKEHYGPYFTDPVVEEIYEKVKSHIPSYNMWDFAVVLNMIASDNHILYMNWWPESTAEERLEKYTEAAVAWLHDDDWKGTDKIWKYLH